MKAQVVTVASYMPKASYYRLPAFKASLAKLGVTPTILGWHEPWAGLMTKERHYRKFLRDNRAEADLLIICDAYDILFAAHPDEIADAFLAWPESPAIVMNAERNCFPRGDLAPLFNQLAAMHNVTTPWKYLNGGFMVGRPADLLAMIDAMNIDDIPDDHQLPDGSWFTPNDQEHFTLAFLKQPVPWVLDYKTELCIACHGSEINEFDWSGPRIKNLITGTYPMVWHGNGSGKNDMFPRVLEHMGL